MTKNKFTHFIKENVAPKGTKEIGVYNKNGKKVGVIPLGLLAPPTSTKQYSFCAISDIHVPYTTGADDFKRALTFVENNDIDFTCICGDLTSSGSDSELEQYKNIVNEYAKTKPVYAIFGNHETLWGDIPFNRPTQYTGYPLYYSFEKGNDVFIMVGYYGKSWSTTDFVTVEELQWLYETLEANRNKRCFVFNHVYPWNDGVGDACRYYNGMYWLQDDGARGQAFSNLLKHYKNTILFHGHSHLRFYLQEKDDKANFSNKVGYRSVHIPSITVPRDKIGDTVTYIYAESEGYIVDVYDDYIILNGRDFIDNDKDGNIIPIATYKIYTTLVNIPKKTFIDSTGTIIV